MAFIDLFSAKNGTLETFLTEIITSPRSDAVWKKAAEKLYAFSNLPVPEPYDHLMTLQTFAPAFIKDRVPASSKPIPTEATPVATPMKGKRTHVVQAGENLWKIARKYKVSIESLKKANRLDTDKLRPGKELFIP